jgi:hypothetical protein
MFGRNFVKDADHAKHPTQIDVCPELLSDKSELLHGIIAFAIANALETACAMLAIRRDSGAHCAGTPSANRMTCLQ